MTFLYITLTPNALPRSVYIRLDFWTAQLVTARDRSVVDSHINPSHLKRT